MAGIIKVNQYQDFNGNTLFTSDGSGNLTTMKANNPSFFAYVSGSQTLSNSTDTKIQFDTELFDTDNCFDNTTNYRFTPTVAGKYVVSAGCRLGTSTNATRWGCYIYKNAALAAIGEMINDEQNTAQINWVFDMNGTTDYLEIYAYQNTGSSQSLNISTGRANWFYSYRIGS